MDEISQVRQKYQEYLKGKKVVVVGPAPTIVGSKQKDIIDSYDVVVRLNKALPLPETLICDVGTRTDVLYNCMNPSSGCGGKISTDLLEANGVKFLIAAYPPTEGYRFGDDIDEYLTENGQKIPFCHFDQRFFDELLGKIKLPNTGISAILDLLSFDISELYITGFTFFKGGYAKEYRSYNEQEVLKRMARFNLHDQDKQWRYMKEVLSNDPRIKMDAALTDIINQQSVSFKIESDKKIEMRPRRGIKLSKTDRSARVQKSRESLVKDKRDKTLKRIKTDSKAKKIKTDFDSLRESIIKGRKAKPEIKDKVKIKETSTHKVKPTKLIIR